MNTRKLALPIAGLTLALLGAAGGVHWWTTGRHVETTDDAYLHSDMAAMRPRVEGRVVEVAVVDNQRVAAGDLLLRLDDRDHKARLDRAEAEAAARAAARAEVAGRADLQRATIRQAEAELDGARAEATRAAADLERYRKLSRDDFASRQRFETAETAARRAEAALAADEAALAAARLQLDVLAAQGKEALAVLAQARAAAELARIDLDDTALRAPVDGVVGNKAVQVGDYLQVGQLVLSVVPLPDVYVVANFKETQLGGMRIGQKATLAIDAYPDAPVDGVIESLSPGTGSVFSLLPPENATGNFTKVVQRVPVRIKVPAGPLAGRLRPGLSVVVTIDTRDAPDPAAARAAAADVFGAVTPPAPGADVAGLE